MSVRGLYPLTCIAEARTAMKYMHTCITILSYINISPLIKQLVLCLLGYQTGILCTL